MPSYNDGFKLECVSKLELLKEKGTINLDGVQIKNVRELVKFLGISSYTIYKWVKEMNYLGRNIEVQDTKKELVESEILADIDEVINGENNLFLDEMYEKHDPILMDDGILSKMMKDIGFWQALARALGMKNYRQATVQLKLRIGNELINGTGLVESQNKVRKELKL